MIFKVLISCCALAAAGAFAAEPAQEGMTVVRDAQTGKLRAPTAAELRALRGAVRQPQMVEPAPLKSVVRPDGTRSIDLGERSMVYSVIQRGADGKLAGHCVKGPAAAAAAVGATSGADHETE